MSGYFLQYNLVFRVILKGIAIEIMIILSPKKLSKSSQWLSVSYLNLVHYDTLCIVIIISFSYSSSFNQFTMALYSLTNNCACGEYHSISKSTKQRCPDEELYIACIVTRVHTTYDSEPHPPILHVPQPP